MRNIAGTRKNLLLKTVEEIVLKRHYLISFKKRYPRFFLDLSSGNGQIDLKV